MSFYKRASRNSCHRNFTGEFPDRYEIVVIKDFLRIAHENVSSCPLFFKEQNNVKQTLINNGFPNYTIDHESILFLSGVNNTNPEHTDNNNNINIFFKKKKNTSWSSAELLPGLGVFYRHLLLCEISTVSDLKRRSQLPHSSIGEFRRWGALDFLWALFISTICCCFFPSRNINKC